MGSYRGGMIHKPPDHWVSLAAVAQPPASLSFDAGPILSASASVLALPPFSGTTFMTTRDTLSRNPHTYFAAMLRMQPPATPGSGGSGLGAGSGGGGSAGAGTGDGEPPPSSSSSTLSHGAEFFIDRDPTHFRWSSGGGRGRHGLLRRSLVGGWAPPRGASLRLASGR